MTGIVVGVDESDGGARLGLEVRLEGDGRWDDRIGPLHGFDPAGVDELRTGFRVVLPRATTAGIQRRDQAVLDIRSAPRTKVGIGSNPTERQAAREQIAGTLEHIRDGVLVVDAEWRIVFANANAARLTQRSVVDVVGQELWECFPDTVSTNFFERFRESMRTQQTKTFEAYFGPLEGWFNVHALPSPAVLSLYFENIDERRAASTTKGALVAQLEEALERQCKTQSGVIAFSDALNVDDVAAAVLREASTTLGAAFAGMALVMDDGTALRFATLGQPPRSVVEWTTVSFDTPSALAQCVRLRKPLYYGSRDELLAAYPDLEATVEAAGSEASANIPLVVGGRLLGAVSMSWAGGRVFSDQDHSLVRMLAAQCAQAIERAQLFSRQMTVADTLQQAMLPDSLPTMKGVDLAACYLPATTDLTVGGDWYDAFQLRDGRLVIAVGDVSGHGVQAAAVMGQLRNALRAYVVDGCGPAAALTKLDEFVDLAGHGLFATVIVGVYDPATGDLAWSNAGHPPLLVRSETTARFVEGHVGAPVGVNGPEGYRDERLTLQVGEQLLGYTDGLIERRGETLAIGLQRLAAAAIAAARPVTSDRWCAALVDDVLSGAPREDDICILVLHRPQ